MYKIVGNLWNNIEYLVISNGQKYYVLNEDKFNGEYYTDCWQVKDRKGFDIVENATEENFEPIYENEEIIGYKMI